MIFCDGIDVESGLLARANAGDMKAQEALYETYSRLLYALSCRFARDEALKEELVHAGYIGLLKAACHYDAQKNVRFVTYGVPWILGEMRRTLRAYARKHDSLSLDQPCGKANQTLRELVGGQCDIDVDAIALRTAVSSLDKEEQLLICLRYYRDMTQKEAALLLKKSQAQISRIERRAIDKLHAALSDG